MGAFQHNHPPPLTGSWRRSRSPLTFNSKFQSYPSGLLLDHRHERKRRSLSPAGTVLLTLIFGFALGLLVAGRSRIQPLPAEPEYHPIPAPPSQGWKEAAVKSELAKANARIAELERQAKAPPASVTSSTPPPSAPASKIGIANMLWGWEEESWRGLMDDALVNHEAYAARHGYPLTVLRENQFDMVWGKQALVLELILAERRKPESSRLEWIFWHDSDTLFTNPLVPLETFLPPQGALDVDLLVTNDIFGLNAGAFMIRTSEWSVRFLSSVLAFRSLKPEVQLSSAEQSAMQELLSLPDFARSTVTVPQRWFNGYRPGMLEGQVTQKGDLLMHFPGDNKRFLDGVLEELASDKSPWKVPLEDLALEEEVRGFWAEARSKRARGEILYYGVESD